MSSKLFEPPNERKEKGRLFPPALSNARQQTELANKLNSPTNRASQQNPAHQQTPPTNKPRQPSPAGKNLAQKTPLFSQEQTKLPHTPREKYYGYLKNTYSLIGVHGYVVFFISQHKQNASDNTSMAQHNARLLIHMSFVCQLIHETNYTNDTNDIELH